MKPKLGDRVTLSLGPTINAGDYNSLKPMVSISRVIGDDPDLDLHEMQAALKTTYQAQLKLEVMALMGTGSLLTSCRSLDDVADAITQGINDGTIQEYLDSTDQEEGHEEEGEEVRSRTHKKTKSTKKRTKRRTKAK